VTRITLPPERPDELLPTRQSLLGRLKDWQDDESWKLFFDTYWKWIYHRATRAGLTDAEAQDVVQETLLSVSKSMKRFDYREINGSFKSWLLQLTTWRIADQIKKRAKEVEPQRPDPEEGPRTEPIERVPMPETDDVDEDWERNLLESALRRVKRKVDPACFQAYELHVFQNWPVAKAAAAINVNAARLYLIKHRINKLLKKEIEHLQKEII
jgi:RNA polymerase sigma-70 factor (ECF subfamily)